jgi:hypothetical protein
VLDDAIATLHPAEGGLHRLDLKGAFTHPHWLAFLCGGLSGAGVSVVSGHAARESPMHWTGHFVLDARGSRTPVESLDLVGLSALRPAVRDATAPRLASFEVRRRADQQIEVRVEAPDELGFLGRLLSRISLLTLLPSELHIHTVRAMIQDRLVLGGIGTAAPSDEVLGSLTELLGALVRPAAPGVPA